MDLTWRDIEIRASKAALLVPEHSRIYGIPNGGVYAAQAVVSRSDRSLLVEESDDATVFVDDVIDSGATQRKYKDEYPDIPFVALVDKEKERIDEWVSFPWERMANVCGPEDNIRRILEYIGENPNREGLKETPSRVVRSYKELFAGYNQDPADVFKTFDGEKYDELVLLKDIELWSHCEHHMIPFVGFAHIAYIPDGRVVGLSKLARLLEIYARRLQIQEKLTTQVTDALEQYLKPKGAACIISARHLCVCARGVGKQHSKMVTSSLTGAFKNPTTRQELLAMINL